MDLGKNISIEFTHNILVIIHFTSRSQLVTGRSKAVVNVCTSSSIITCRGEAHETEHEARAICTQTMMGGRKWLDGVEFRCHTGLMELRYMTSRPEHCDDEDEPTNVWNRQPACISQGERTTTSCKPELRVSLVREVQENRSVFRVRTFVGRKKVSVWSESSVSWWFWDKPRRILTFKKIILKPKVIQYKQWIYNKCKQRQKIYQPQKIFLLIFPPEAIGCGGVYN